MLYILTKNLLPFHIHVWKIINSHQGFKRRLCSCSYKHNLSEGCLIPFVLFLAITVSNNFPYKWIYLIINYRPIYLICITVESIIFRTLIEMFAENKKIFRMVTQNTYLIYVMSVLTQGNRLALSPSCLGFFPFFTVFFCHDCVRCSRDSRGSFLGLTRPTLFIKLSFILTFTKVFNQTLPIFVY